MPPRPAVSSVTQELSNLKTKFEDWRNQSQKGSRRIPEPLWEEATQLAVRFGVSTVSCPLRLDYARLKKRVLAKTAGGETMLRPVKRTSPITTEFVELFGSRNSCRALNSCVLQVESARGSRMRVDIDGLDAPGLALLLREFV